jgi:hypothetical protein
MAILEEITLTKSLIDAIKNNNNQKNHQKKETKMEKTENISRSDYILHMLQLEGKLDYDHDITRWDLRFNEFDIDEDNYLSIQDVNAYHQVIQRKKISESLRMIKSPIPKENRYYSLLKLFYNETRDVFLETIGYKKEADDPLSSSSSPTKNKKYLSTSILKPSTTQDKVKEENGDFELHTIYPATDSGSSAHVEEEKEGYFGVNPLQEKVVK